MNQMLCFQDVDVSNTGPFNSEQVLYFSEGVTLVAGESGAGKTTIVKKLRREYEDTKNLPIDRDMHEIPSWLVFFDDDVRTPYAGAPWGPLALLMSSNQEFFTRRREFDSNLTKHVRQLLGTKIKRNCSKFSTRIDSPDQLYVTLDEHGSICITDNNGDSIVDCFHAMGESLVLFLSVNAAVRKLLFLDVPFVIDSRLGCLDQELCHSCYQFITEIGKQAIIVESNSIVEMLGLRPNFQIIHDPNVQRSTIKEIVSLKGL